MIAANKRFDCSLFPWAELLLKIQFLLLATLHEKYPQRLLNGTTQCNESLGARSEHRLSLKNHLTDHEPPVANARKHK